MSSPKEIAKIIKPITLERAQIDFVHLQQLALQDTILLSSKVGTDCIDFFTFEQRLQTVGYQGLSFFEFLDQLPTLKKQKYIQNMVQYYKRERPNTHPLSMWYRIFSMYFGSINVFKPAIALSIYKTLLPISRLNVLDPTMGWGGRLIAAAAANVHSYTGIDSNLKLQTPYRKMIDFLERAGTKTHIQCHFMDALHFNYSALNYNMVLTSPPYYNKEIYKHMKKRKTKEEWDTDFYIPLFTKTMKYLKKGGVYCLNVSPDIYNRVCVPLFGETQERVAMTLFVREHHSDYGEFIYIWRKN